MSPALLLLAGMLAGVAAGDGVAIERRVGTMGTTLSIELAAADRDAALAASEVAVRAVEAAAARLSTWTDTSELARLNATPPGAPFAPSPALAADLEAARACAAATGGAFDPTVGALVAAWGLREGGRVPDAGERARAVAATGMARLREAPDGTLRREVAGLRLEEGAFGKGAALDAAAAALARDGRARAASLDLGGQVALFGPPAPHAVALADPRDRARPVVALTIDGGSVATSANGERGFSIHGVAYGHLLDPRSGAPARDFGSLTVWAPSGFLADCLSTGLYVLGPEAALAWAGDHPGVEVLVLEPIAAPAGDEETALRARASAGWRGRLRPLAPDLRIDFVKGG